MYWCWENCIEHRLKIFSRHEYMAGDVRVHGRWCTGVDRIALNINTKYFSQLHSSLSMYWCWENCIEHQLKIFSRHEYMDGDVLVLRELHWTQTQHIFLNSIHHWGCTGGERIALNANSTYFSQLHSSPVMYWCWENCIEHKLNIFFSTRVHGRWCTGVERIALATNSTYFSQLHSSLGMYWCWENCIEHKPNIFFSTRVHGRWCTCVERIALNANSTYFSQREYMDGDVLVLRELHWTPTQHIFLNSIHH